jgi:hypothetical protein
VQCRFGGPNDSEKRTLRGAANPSSLGNFQEKLPLALQNVRVTAQNGAYCKQSADQAKFFLPSFSALSPEILKARDCAFLSRTAALVQRHC